MPDLTRKGPPTTTPTVSKQPPGDLAGSRVLVAGGAGFIGSAVVRELLLRGARVVCFDNFLYGTMENLLDVSGLVTVVTGDVLDPWQLIKCLEANRVDYIINCVGDTFVPASYEVPKRFLDTNIQGTFNVLVAAHTYHVRRLVYASTTEVYGEVMNGAISETFPLNPMNTYAVTKLAADRLCYTFHVEHHVPVVIARLFNCYGPRETHPYVIPEIISQLSVGGKVFLGNISAQRDLTYVEDTARALVSLLCSPVPDGTAVNIGSNRVYSTWNMHRITLPSAGPARLMPLVCE